MTRTELKLSIAPEVAAMLVDVTAAYDAISSDWPGGLHNRFDTLDGDDPNAPAWRGGTLSWCADVADALLFQAYEQASGHRTMLLWDVIWFGNGGPGAAVLSTRPSPLAAGSATGDHGRA